MCVCVCSVRSIVIGQYGAMEWVAPFTSNRSVTDAASVEAALEPLPNLGAATVTKSLPNHGFVHTDEDLAAGRSFAVGRCGRVQSRRRAAT